MTETTITFETATIADAVSKANKVAPSTRGMAWDRAYGILFDINPSADYQLMIRTTNLDVFRTEWVNALSSDGEAQKVRLPSVLTNVLEGLPLGAGKTVTFTVKDGKAEIQSGNMRCRFNTLNEGSYPEWEVFDPDDLSLVPNLVKAVKQVEWAADKIHPVLSGIHLDGGDCIGTDRYRAAIVPCEIPQLSEPITIPANTLSLACSEHVEPRIGSKVSDGLLRIMPDDWTQLSIRTLGGEYPTAIKKIKTGQFDRSVLVNKEAFLNLVRRVSSIDNSNKLPVVRLFFGKEELAAFMNNEDVGLLRDLIECPGQANHPRIEYQFNLQHLVSAVSSVSDRQVLLAYGEPDHKPMLHISNPDKTYDAWVARSSGVKASTA